LRRSVPFQKLTPFFKKDAAAVWRLSAIDVNFRYDCNALELKIGGRNRVERFFNRIKQCRRVATRYDKLAANYLAFVQLASIRLWLRDNESTP